MYQFDIDKVIIEVKAKKPHRVLLQFPEGLKQRSVAIATQIEQETAADVCISAEPCWGACDLPLEEAKQLNADLIVHFGHAPFHQTTIPILYVEIWYDTNITPLLERALPLLKPRIALVASVQHLHQLPKAKAFLEQHGKAVIIPSGTARAVHEGQILGCEYTGPKAARFDADCFLAIGNQFHALGLVASTDKPVILVAPLSNEVVDLSSERMKLLKQRYALIQYAAKAKTFAFLVSTKSGQWNLSVAQKLKAIAEQQGKSAVIITAREITPDEVLNFREVDVFVSTACPRIGMEEAPRFEKPVLTFNEALVALNQLKYETLIEHGFITPPYEVP